MKKFLHLFLTPALSAFLLCSSTLAQVEIEEKRVQLGKDKHYVTGMRETGISGGFGFADEDEFITDFILMPKWGIILADFDGPVPGAFELELEGVAGMNATPEIAAQAGFNLLFTYNFETGTKFVPFFSAGAGALYTTLDVNELGSRLNGSPQGGLGVKYFLNDKTSLSFMGRLRHISNAGTASPNRGVDSFFLLFGIN
ncbi:MAG: acyloxyacyl hydrolase, partial [Candidatus Brocadiales bacterium]